MSKAVVLGNGGAALGAVVACQHLGIADIVVTARAFREDVASEAWPHADEFSRLGARPLAWLASSDSARQEVLSAGLVLQATSAGMKGAEGGEALAQALPWAEFGAGTVIYDFVYNPPLTPVLARARERGLVAEGGLSMLVAQAQFAIQIWLGRATTASPAAHGSARSARRAARMKARERSYWRGPEDGPWPALEVKGDLERAEIEWLHTNGAGAYAMSTVALMHTRRNHGLLVAALKPPLDRYVVLSHAESSVRAGGRSYRLATHQFPEIAPTPGYRLIESFAMDPLPRWVCRLGKGTLERTVSLARGRNAVVLSYTWSAKESAQLTVRPLMPLRPVEELMHEHGGMMQTVTLRPGEVEVQPTANLPPLNFSHGGVFMGSPDWWRRFEYLEDRVRHLTFQEDMWSPGTFEITLHSNQTQYIVMSVGPLPTASPAELVIEAAEHILAQDPGPKYTGYVRSLFVAAEQFSARTERDEVVVAGYPWLDVWSRDAAIALVGIYLCRGHVEEAKRCVSTLIRHMHSGMLPQTLTFRIQQKTRACAGCDLVAVRSRPRTRQVFGAGRPVHGTRAVSCAEARVRAGGRRAQALDVAERRGFGRKRRGRHRAHLDGRTRRQSPVHTA